MTPTIFRASKELGIARSTVARCCARITKSGYSYARFRHLSYRKMSAALQSAVKHGAPPARYFALLKGFPEVLRKLYMGEADLRESWSYYRSCSPDGYGYSQFVFHFRVWERHNGMHAARCTKWRITNINEEDVLELKKWRRSNDRTKWAKAVVVLDSYKGRALSFLYNKTEKSRRLVNRWLFVYKQKGIAGLRVSEARRLSPDKLAEIQTKRERIINILHESPQLHEINRASWSLKTLAIAFKHKFGESIGKTTISEYVKAEGYVFRKARRVLTSPDPNYREKLQKITERLSNLGNDEKFFSIDEFGPFSVKLQGGRVLSRRGTARLVPQRQRSRGRLILTAALELSTNQITHFYSDKKNTGEMLKLLDTLLRKYRMQRCLYLSWDAASWHMSGELTKRVDEINASVEAGKGDKPLVKLVPLPASAQFLNVIESVFSGMARAVLHNSDYKSVDECKEAIDRYLVDRNEAYRKMPKRAGNKIWGKELVEPCFKASNNCKDLNWR